MTSGCVEKHHCLKVSRAVGGHIEKDAWCFLWYLVFQNVAVVELAIWNIEVGFSLLMLWLI